MAAIFVHDALPVSLAHGSIYGYRGYRIIGELIDMDVVFQRAADIEAVRLRNFD